MVGECYGMSHFIDSIGMHCWRMYYKGESRFRVILLEAVKIILEILRY